MNETEFFDLLWILLINTDVDYERFWMGDEKEGEIYVKFTNVQKSKEADDVDM